MRINVFLFYQHGIRAIKEFENTRVRVSPCSQFLQPIQRPCQYPIELQSSTTYLPAEEHTNRSASIRSTFRWKPRWKITSHALTCADLRSIPVCLTLFFTRASTNWCLCRRQGHPSTPRAPSSPEKPFFLSFSLRSLLLRFSVA